VLDIGISTAGPYAARLLGDLGADVIKIEPLAGENTRGLGLRYGGQGYLYHVNNYNKRSVTLTLQHLRGRDLFLELVAHSDVVIENFAIGTMDKWGVGFAACREANPAIIYCSVKGFGESGPLAGLRAFDTVTQALCGLMHSTGKPGDPPLKAGPSVCDLMGAAVSSMAVMTAIAARAPGHPRFLDTALFDMGAIALTSLWPLARDGEPSSLRSLGNAHPEHAPFDDYACADGRIMRAVPRVAHGRALSWVLRLPSGGGRAARLAHRDAIDSAIGAWVGARDMEQAANDLQALGIPAAPVLDLAQVANSAQMQSRRMIGTQHHAVYGDVPLINTPLAIGDEASRAPWRRQPLLGEHNAEVIGDLLGHAAELDALREQGVIR
jgi:CoA:oxalate CoA-transferase